MDSWGVALTQTDLRRREFKETVIAEDPADTSSAKVSPVDGNFHIMDAAKYRGLPACFNTLSNCAAQTGNCSGHGDCIAKGKGCYTCKCKATLVRPVNESESYGPRTAHWGGRACQKEDVSVPFWLLTGFTIAILGVVSFAIGLLFSVGEEPLPGVIAAGVSRTK